jgi:hypothetical protein
MQVGLLSPVLCLDCGEPDAPPLRATSPFDRVMYYRCRECGCLWAVDKDHPQASPRRLRYSLKPRQEWEDL